MIAERFAKLFSGYEQAYGQFVEKQKKGEKADGDFWTVQGAPSFESHLAGKVGLGIIPLKSDNTLSFAAIDIDVYNVNHKKLEKQILKLKLPLIVCRSKSGGAHCYVFFKEDLPAKIVIDKLKTWAAALGHGGCEIFPKQSERLSPEDLGNWINMPYFAGEQSFRYAILDGKRLTPSDFLDFAEAQAVTLEQFEAITIIKKTHELLEGAPPCVQQFYSRGGIPDGIRSDSMFDVGVFCKKKWPDDWKAKVVAMNELLCDPPLSETELKNTIIRSVAKKSSYEMRCKGPYCNKSKCCKAEFGRGLSAAALDALDVSSVTKVLPDAEDEDAMWFVQINERRIGLSTKQIMYQHQFQEAMLDKLNVLPPRVKDSEWYKWLQKEIIDRTDEVTLPEEITWRGLFWQIFGSFIHAQGLQGDNLADIDGGRVYQDTEAGRTAFLPSTLMDYLREAKFPLRRPSQMWAALTDKGVKRESEVLEGKHVQYWTIETPKTIERTVTPIRKGEEPF